MVTIKKIAHRKSTVNKKAIKQVQNILRSQIPGLSDKKVSLFPETIFGPQKNGFYSRLYIGLDDAPKIVGFISYSYFAKENFYFLDYVAVTTGLTGQGIGSEIYGFLRGRAKAKKAIGIFFECLSDDPQEVADTNALKQNQARLRFYEKFGARPIINNKYDTKVDPGDNSTHLIFDPLDRKPVISRGRIKKIVRRIIEKKYSDYCPPGYVKMVVDSFRDNPAVIREPMYVIKK
jgi:predicted GNAT superfamily acetyltransferase